MRMFASQELGIRVLDWNDVKQQQQQYGSYSQPRIGREASDQLGSYPSMDMELGGGRVAGSSRGPRSYGTKAPKVMKNKANSSGRTYTSRFRGVHQTFPTKRWEAQVRRGGAAVCALKEDLSGKVGGSELDEPSSRTHLSPPLLERTRSFEETGSRRRWGVSTTRRRRQRRMTR